VRLKSAPGKSAAARSSRRAGQVDVGLGGELTAGQEAQAQHGSGQPDGPRHRNTT
jgi:hypothetical protein